MQAMLLSLTQCAMQCVPLFTKPKSARTVLYNTHIYLIQVPQTVYEKKAQMMMYISSSSWNQKLLLLARVWPDFRHSPTYFGINDEISASLAKSDCHLLLPDQKYTAWKNVTSFIS